jgi:hypothetical protein
MEEFGLRVTDALGSVVLQLVGLNSVPKVAADALAFFTQ